MPTSPACIAVFVLAAIASGAHVDNQPFTLSSPAFADSGAIPAAYTCDGSDHSPPLTWSGVPPAARSLVLIVDDPDAPDPAAPQRTWVHWVLYNLPPNSVGLAEAVPALPTGTKSGINDWERTGYGGPCPPIGRHRYFHKLYALDTLLAPTAEPTKAVILNLMKGHIIKHAELVGTYQRAR